MTNSDSPAFAAGGENWHQEGLSKREYFAAMAMQGMLANINQSFGKPNVNEQSMKDSLKREQQFIGDVAEKSIRYADALIEALNKA